MEKFNISKIVANFRRKGRFSKEKRPFCGAATQIRTGDLILTKDALYRLSYSSKSSAIALNLATRKGLEPSTSGVTGRRSNQLNYRAIFVSEYHKQIAL